MAGGISYKIFDGKVIYHKHRETCFVNILVKNLHFQTLLSIFISLSAPIHHMPMYAIGLSSNHLPEELVNREFKILPEDYTISL